MVAQDVKLIRDLLSTDEPYAVRESATFPSITHAGWREVPTLLVDRLNWHGEKRAVASTEAVQCCVPAVTNVQIGDDAVVVTKHGRHVITITAEHTVTDFMVTVPGIDRDPANKMWCDRLHVPRGLVALIEGVDIAQELRKKLDLPAGWLKVLRHYARLHHTAHIRLPATAEECLSMPIFGSPHILLDDSSSALFRPLRRRIVPESAPAVPHADPHVAVWMPRSASSASSLSPTGACGWHSESRMCIISGIAAEMDGALLSQCFMATRRCRLS